MGRIAKLEEDTALVSTLASDPALDVDIELLLVLLARQAQAWRKLVEAHRASGTPLEGLFAYEKMLDQVQLVLSKVSEIGRPSSGDRYTRSAR